MVPREQPHAEPSVLIVEDEVMLLTVAAETLRDAGFTVREASDGQTAVKILERHPDINLLITDIKMPGMSGYEVAEAGMTLRPNLKILLMTGYAQGPFPKRIAEAGIQVLYKPFDFNALPTLAERILKS